MFVISSILALTLQAAGSETPDFETEILAEGLDYPWAIAELSAGEFLITEKPGALRWYHQGQLQPDPVSGTPSVLYGGQGGLLDIVARKATMSVAASGSFNDGTARPSVFE